MCIRDRSNSISITTNGQELKIVNATLASGETLVVDTDRMTAYVEDADGMILRNALPYLEELNFPTLAVGKALSAVTELYFDEESTLGILTMEDLLEEIVGDIWDEDEEIEHNYYKICLLYTSRCV